MHGLEEDAGQEDGADEQRGRAEHHGRAGHQGADLPGVRRDQRPGRPALDADERGEQERGGGERDQGLGRQPAVRGGAGQAVHEGAEAADDGEGAGQVELGEAGAGGDVLRQDLEPDGERDDADGDVDPEDELPAGPGGERPAEQDAGGDAEAADGAPQGEAAGALRAGVGGHDQRQRGGGHQGGAEALGGAGGDELGGVVREAAGQGGAGEDGHAGEEDPVPRDQVGDAAAEEQTAAGQQQVGGDQPLQVAAAQAQRLADGRQRGVDDGDVEHDQDLGGQGEGEDGPRLAGTSIGLRLTLRDLVRHWVVPAVR